MEHWDDLKLTMSVESFGKKFTAEANADMDIHDFLELCKTMAIAVGYMETSWNDAILASSAEVDMQLARKDYEDNRKSHIHSSAVRGSPVNYSSLV